MKTKIGELCMLIGMILLIQPFVDENSLNKLSIICAKYWPILLILLGYKLLKKSRKSKYR